MVSSRDGSARIMHKNWHEDKYAPDHKPAIGDRVFISMEGNEQVVRARAEELVERMWDDEEYPIRQQFQNKHQAVLYYVGEWMSDPAAPLIIEVEQAAPPYYKPEKDNGDGIGAETNVRLEAEGGAIHDQTA